MVATPGWLVNAHFPDGTVEQVTVHEEPKVGTVFLARDAEWRIAVIRLPDEEQRLDLVYDVDAEPAHD
jgi:hypothetical protein